MITKNETDIIIDDLETQSLSLNKTIDRLELDSINSSKKKFQTNIRFKIFIFKITESF